jgi:branched-chain amino acid transport system permease protein
MISQQILNGLISGTVYALFALGFNIIFGIHRILNLAHGAIFMTGAFVGLWAATLGLPFWTALLVAMLAGGVTAVLVDQIAFRRLRRQGQPEFSVMVASIGANLVLISIAQNLSNTQVLRFPSRTFPVIIYQVLGLRISLLQIVIVATVITLCVLLALYMYMTSFGRQIRAVAGDERAAVLLGVSPAFVYFQTFFLSGVFAGAAGVLIGLAFNSVSFLMGDPYMLRAFLVLVIGGLGSLPGAVFAGLLLGIIQNMSNVYLPGMSDIIIFSLLFLVLLVRPNGLFGAHVADASVGRK